MIAVMVILLFKKYNHYEAQGIGIIPIFFINLLQHKKISIVIHDLSSNTKDQWISSGKIFELFEKIAYRLPFKKIITVSDHVKQRLIKEYRIPAERIFRVYNGIDSKYIDSIPYQRKERTVIFIGRLIPHKHVDDLIQAINMIPRLKLNIIGIGPEESNLKKLVGVLNAQNRVNFFGTVTDRRKFELIKKSQMLVLPSTREGFGIVLAEAMYSGIPVIAYESDGASEIISGQTGILIPKRDWKTLKEQIEMILKNKKLGSTLSKKGRMRVKQNFLIESTVENLMKIYSS